MVSSFKNKLSLILILDFFILLLGLIPCYQNSEFQGFLSCSLVKSFKEEKGYTKEVFALCNLETVDIIYEEKNTFSSHELWVSKHTISSKKIYTILWAGKPSGQQLTAPVFIECQEFQQQFVSNKFPLLGSEDLITSVVALKQLDLLQDENQQQM